MGILFEMLQHVFQARFFEASALVWDATSGVLVGRTPSRGMTTADLMSRHLGEDFSMKNPGFSPTKSWFCNWVVKLLRIKPEFLFLFKMFFGKNGVESALNPMSWQISFQTVSEKFLVKPNLGRATKNTFRRCLTEAWVNYCAVGLCPSHRPWHFTWV